MAVRKASDREYHTSPRRRRKTSDWHPEQRVEETENISANARFQVHPRQKYDVPSATFRKPMFIGDFSLDAKRQFCHDKRNFHFMNIDWHKSKKVEYDLNVAMDKVTRKDYEETRTEKLDRILEWILCNTYKFHTKDSSEKPLQCLSTDFVCFRGLLTELLCTSYESRDGWIICATKFCSTIYLCAFETPEKKSQRENETEFQKKMCSWGYKFEQYMTDGSNTAEGVNENEEYCCVVRSRLESHSLVYGAEVDGADPSKYKSPHADLKAFVELKTNKALITDNDVRTLYRFKLKKWWSQSYLVGIPLVVCGFRDQEGIVHTLNTYQVEEMPFIAQDYWKPNVMLNFLNRFLEFVKIHVQVDDPEAVYKFEREPNGGNISCTYLGHDSNWAFLPKWYYEKVFHT